MTGSHDEKLNELEGRQVIQVYKTSDKKRGIRMKRGTRDSSDALAS